MAEDAKILESRQRMAAQLTALGYLPAGATPSAQDVQTASAKMVEDLRSIINLALADSKSNDKIIRQSKINASDTYTPELGQAFQRELDALKVKVTPVKTLFGTIETRPWEAMQAYANNRYYYTESPDKLKLELSKNGFTPQLIANMPAVVKFIDTGAPAFFSEMNVVQAAAVQEQRQKNEAAQKRIDENPQLKAAQSNLKAALGLSDKPWDDEAMNRLRARIYDIQIGKLPLGLTDAQKAQIPKWTLPVDGRFTPEFAAYFKNDFLPKLPPASVYKFTASYQALGNNMGALVAAGLYKADDVKPLTPEMMAVNAAAAPPKQGYYEPRHPRTIPQLTPLQMEILVAASDHVVETTPNANLLFDQLMVGATGCSLQQLLAGDASARPADLSLHEGLTAGYRMAISGTDVDRRELQTTMIHALEAASVLPFGTIERKQAVIEAAQHAFAEAEKYPKPHDAARIFSAQFCQNLNEVENGVGGRPGHGRPEFDKNPPPAISPFAAGFHTTDGRNINDIVHAYNEINKTRLVPQMLIFKDTDGKVYTAGVEHGSNMFTVMEVDPAEMQKLRDHYNNAIAPHMNGKDRESWNATYQASETAIKQMMQESRAYNLAMGSYPGFYTKALAFMTETREAKPLDQVLEAARPKPVEPPRQEKPEAPLPDSREEWKRKRGEPRRSMLTEEGGTLKPEFQTAAIGNTAAPETAPVTTATATETLSAFQLTAAEITAPAISDSYPIQNYQPRQKQAGPAVA